MAKYPQYELKVIYDCTLCKDNHTVVSRLVGSQLAAELAGAIVPSGQSLLKRGKEIAKRNVVRDFFTAHSEAKVSDFDVDTLIGHEMVQHTEDDEKELDKVGIPMIKEEVENWYGELMAEKKEAVVVEGKEEPLVTKKPAELSGDARFEEQISTFEDIETVIKNKLGKLEKEEAELEARLVVVKIEIRQFELMADATEKARLDTKMDDLKKE